MTCRQCAGEFGFVFAWNSKRHRQFTTCHFNTSTFSKSFFIDFLPRQNWSKRKKFSTLNYAVTLNGVLRMLECSRLYHRNEDNHFWLIFNGNLNAIVWYISFINEMTHAIYVWFSFFLHIDKIRFDSELLENWRHRNQHGFYRETLIPIAYQNVLLFGIYTIAHTIPNTNPPTHPTYQLLLFNFIVIAFLFLV